MVRHNTVATAPFPIVSLLRVMFVASEKYCVLAARDQTTAFARSVFLDFQGELTAEYITNIH